MITGVLLDTIRRRGARLGEAIIEATEGKVCPQSYDEVEEKECEGLKTVSKGKDALLDDEVGQKSVRR